jgi:hypothetical protein
MSQKKKTIISYFYFPFKDNEHSKYHNRTDKSGYTFSETLSTSKNNDNEDDDDDDDDGDGITTNSALNYKRFSQEMQMPPTVEDIHDEEDTEEQHEQGESENDLSSPEVFQRRKQSEKTSEKTEERLKSASSRPKTASTRSHTDNEELKSPRASSSTSSDDTSALLRSDNDNSPNISDDELNNEEEQAPIETPVKSSRTSSNASNIMNFAEEEKEDVLPQPIEKLSQRDVKGEYDPSQVIQLKESFQPIINEAASYGHLDIVRKLIEVISFLCTLFSIVFLFLVWSKCSYTKSLTTYTTT